MNSLSPHLITPSEPPLILAEDKEADLIEAKFLETLREFAWEVWKASAKSDDQSRETFDKFYTDLSNS